MPNKVLILTETAHAVLLEMVTVQLTSQALQIGTLDKKKVPAQHAEASNSLAALAGIHAQLTEQLPTLESTGYRDANEEHGRRLDAATRERMLQAGLNPDRDDPRALDPYCAHGVSFRDECPRCNLDTIPKTSPALQL